MTLTHRTPQSAVGGQPGRMAGCPTVGKVNMLWAIFVILLLLWILGFSLHVAGSLIHLLLVIAFIVLVVNLLTGRSAA